MPFKSQKQRAWMHTNKPKMAKRWEKEIPKGKLPMKVKQAVGDVDDLESGDPTRMMPRLRQIHKMSGMEKTDSFLGTLSPNKGEPVNEGPIDWRPRKLKYAAGVKSIDPASMEFALKDPYPEWADKLIPPLLTMAREPTTPGRKMVEMAAERLGELKDEVAEKEKRSYKLQGHTNVQGLRVAVENRKGSVRSGKDKDGHEWRTKMKNPYGYLVGTKGADGEEVDCYVGPNKDAKDAFVVHQHKDTGKGYDEDKALIGFESKKEAKEAYLKHYDDPKFLGPISRVSIERLKQLVASKKKLVKIS